MVTAGPNSQRVGVGEQHYINRKFVVPDYRAATERLAPDSGPSEGPEPGR